jgi:hypothetical protein
LLGVPVLVVVGLGAVVEVELVSPPEELDEREGAEPAAISVFTCVLRAMITEVVGCPAGDALLPALVGGSTATQPARPGVTVHAATDGSTAPQPATVGAAVH